MKRRLLLCAVLLTAVSVGAVAARADPPTTISVTPAGEIKAGITYTFEASPADPTDAWDLDGDGVTDKLGSQVNWAYRQPGPVLVTLNSPGGSATKQLQVLGVNADFSVFPAAPIVGQAVQFVYTAHEATSAIEWDLNGDDQFGDVKGPVAGTTFSAPGTYAVSLQVTDTEDPPPAVSTSTRLVTVVPAPGSLTSQNRPQVRFLSPFPVVRITGKVGRRGALIKRLTIRAPYGATVKVSCRGRGCPFRHSSRTLALAGKAKTPAKTIRIQKLEQRLLHGGASIKVLVSRPGEVGKYTRFLIRRKRPPRRTDLCLAPGSTKPMECPSS